MYTLNIKMFVKNNFPFLFNILKLCRKSFYLYLGKHYPELLIKKLYYNYYNRKINLSNPRDIDEKVNYLKLYSDTTLWSRCADKFEVRKYVEEKGLGFTLNDIYGIYDNPREIDFNNLPKSFVIKTTNGGGGNTVLIVKDKNALNFNNTIKLLEQWLRRPMGSLYGETHYDKIRPRLIIEKYLEIPKGQASLVDYKFNCFNGKTYSVFLCSDRLFNAKVCYSVYDLDWKLYPNKMKKEYSTDKTFPRPSSLDLMIKYSNILSEGIPYVRVDWYEIEGKPIFGEMTFTPAGGFQQFYSDEYLLELGQQMDISNYLT